MARGIRACVRAQRNEQGAAAVETAICLCFVVLPLTFAIISYAFMLSFRQSVSQAATEGARSAAVALTGTSDTDRTSRAKAAINNALTGLVGTHVCDDGKLTCPVTYGPCPAPSTARCATVRVEYLYRANPLVPSVPMMGFILPRKVAYSAVAEVS